MQYPLSLQNQGPFQNMVQPLNQGNSIRGVNPELSPSSVQKSFNAMQLGSPYPAIPGMQYPGSYPGGCRCGTHRIPRKGERRSSPTRILSM